MIISKMNHCVDFMTDNNEITVKSYQHTASIGGWSGAGRTLWAIAAVGAVFGAAIGLIAPLAPLLVTGAAGAGAAIAAIPTSVAVFAATGLSMGFGGGLMLGRISGTAAAVAEESERRNKEWTIRQIKSMNPEAKIIPDAPEEKPAKPSLKDTLRTYINPRVGLAMTLIGAVGGLIVGAAFVATGAAPFAIMPALGAITGLGAETFASAAAIAANSAPIMAYSAGVGAAFGSLWNFNMPKITGKATEFFGKLTSGEMLGRKWEPEPAKSVEPQHAPIVQQPVAEPVLQEPASRNFSSFQELVTRQTTVTHSLAKH